MFNVGTKVQILTYLPLGKTVTGTVTASLVGDDLFDHEVFVDGYSDAEPGMLSKVLFGKDTFPFAKEELVKVENV